jgi:hypothetical protein
MITVYGDESYDGSQEQVFVVAAIMGTQGQWEEFEPKWLEITEGRVFHAADWESEHGGPFHDVPFHKRLEKYKDLTQLLVQSDLFGYGVALDLKAWKDLAPDTHRDSPYSVCFNRCLSIILAAISKCPQEIEFAFDMNLKMQANAAYYYDILANRSELEYTYVKYMADRITFICRKTVGIQAADLWARELMKYCSDCVLGKKKNSIRTSFKVLLDSGNFRWGLFNEKELQRARQTLDEDTNSGIRKAMEQEPYAVWLGKRSNNVRNVLEYWRHLNSIAEKAEREKSKSD